MMWLQHAPARALVAKINKLNAKRVAARHLMLVMAQTAFLRSSAFYDSTDQLSKLNAIFFELSFDFPARPNEKEISHGMVKWQTH